jgi:phage host-nuclease inhibitor protein Gam
MVIINRGIEASLHRILLRGEVLPFSWRERPDKVKLLRSVGLLDLKNLHRKMGIARKIRAKLDMNTV